MDNSYLGSLRHEIERAQNENHPRTVAKLRKQYERVEAFCLTLSDREFQLIEEIRQGYHGEAYSFYLVARHLSAANRMVTELKRKAQVESLESDRRD